MRGLYRRAGRLKLILTATLVCMLLMMVYQMMVTTEEEDEYEQYHNSDRQIKSSYTYDSERSSDPVYYDKSVPLIWVGGVPRSGTTLARAMLDAHPDIRCGEETRIIPRLLAMHGHLMKSDKEMARLREAKITEGIMDDALGAYLLSIIVKHGEPAQRLCNKDPFALKSIPKLLKIFPKSKFILMVRDGRATVHSIISRKVTIRGFDTKTYRGALRDWNRAAETMYVQCLSAGKDTCLVVHYEQLVLHPESQMRRILKFLGVPWNNIVIHHEDAVGKGGGISLSKKELSTDQVVKPVNTGALTKWASFIPQDVRDDIHNIAPMLQKLGYDPDQYPPEYGIPDRIVQEHSDSLHMSQKARQKERLKNSSL